VYAHQTELHYNQSSSSGAVTDGETFGHEKLLGVRIYIVFQKALKLATNEM